MGRLVAEVAEQMSQGHEADDDGGDAHGGEEPGLLDALDPKVGAYVQKLRHEAADRRVAVAEAEQRLAAAGDEVARLQAWQEDRMRLDVEAIALAHRMISPSELWLVASLAEMLGDDSDIDPNKVAEVVEQRVPDHWRVPVQYPKHTAGPRSGATGLAQIRPASW